MSFIKWMGGKSKVLHLFKDYFPTNFKGYIEPFLGGGSVFFYLKENGYLNDVPVYLSDINNELITTYKVVRDNLNELIPLLEKHEKLNSDEHYNKIKKQFPPGIGMTDIEKSAAFIYLINNSMAGRWLLHKNGTCANQYVGNKYKEAVIKDDLSKCSRLLKGTDIRCYSFENVLNLEKEIGNIEGYYIYFDPPYYGVSHQQHSKDDFNINSQMNIPKIFKELDKRGCKVMMSNSDCNITRRYFKDYNITQIQTNRRNIDLKGITKESINNAQKWTEVVISNYDVKKRQRTIEDAWS